jgi:phosphohistidine swiveling domain-containing protein
MDGESGRRGVPAGTFTRRIAEDLWADPLTSFEEALLVSLSPRFDLRGPARWAGIHIPDAARVLTGIGSYLYVSCDLVEEVVKVLPPALRIARIVSLFPPGRSPRELPAPPLARVARAALGAAALGLLHPDANPLTASIRGRVRSQRLESEARTLGAVEVSGLSDPLLAAHLSRCVDLLGRILEADQFIYLWAFVSSWGIEWAAGVLGIPREVWLSHLGGTEKNATRRMEQLLEEAGEALRSSGVELAGRSFEEVVDDLEARGHHKAAAAARVLRSQFGVRASQRSLVERRWAEDPLSILLRARRFAQPAPAHHRNGEGTLPLLFQLALRWANRKLDLREDQRFLIDAALFAIRRAVLEAGRRYGLDGDAFFLLPEEVTALFAGRLDPAEARARAKERHARYRTAVTPPAFWVHGQPVRGTMPHHSGNQITGVGASPGIASGRVRIVERLEDTAGIERGDLVVAPLMGPAWTPILRIAGGVLTEKGGLLDHFAILAREAAVPAVTGAEDAIAALRGVERATIDGTRGIVTW